VLKTGNFVRYEKGDVSERGVMGQGSGLSGRSQDSVAKGLSNI